MSEPPAAPKIYHITHVDNLRQIVAAGGLYSDTEMIRQDASVTAVGLSGIKQDRLALPVKCHSNLMVGDCVPFYFCPRSVMLYILHKANRPGLTYFGGQGPIVHLEADFNQAVVWAEAEERVWAFSLGNASVRYAEFSASLNELDRIHWPSVRATNWSHRDVQEAKQAEFLMHQFFPWHLVSRVGVQSQALRRQVEAIIGAGVGIPKTEIRPD